ncbi:MAG TPA: sodium/solute symporter [Cyclobacteriaceae bacterium]|jgi:SSS family solute:Na+ symporter|nr:sodium/solute symporter [Cyclobacteriaceae bacterium]
MNKGLEFSDYVVFLIYFFVVAVYGYWIYNRKKKVHADSKDFFLAEGSLTWWAIGASLIASNISAEQFIGMSGDGFAMGLAIATYEWLAAATLIGIAIFFLPIYLKNKIYTMPQFLRQRYSPQVANIMAVFWLSLYIVVNLTSILFLGALAISTISGFNFTFCMMFLAVFAIAITLGGMKVIGYTDVIQVFFLILGGVATTYLALDLVGQQIHTPGIFGGLTALTQQASDHFVMVFSKDSPHFMSMPGLSVIMGGMLIVHLNYWGCNQYITQRALGADLKTARSGLLFASYLKLLMPIIVVLPGIAAYVLWKNGGLQTEMLKDGELVKDNAYPVLLNLLPHGLKGLSFAALTAAVVASLAGKANSISTIFTLDIYKNSMNKSASEKTLVWVGRLAVVGAMILALLLAPFLGIDKKGGFEFIQEYTGFVSPGIFAMFILGFFWKRATAKAAMFAIVGGFLLSVFFKVIPPYVDLSFLNSSGFAVVSATSGLYEIPFLDRMAFVFVLVVVAMIAISYSDSKVSTSTIEVDPTMFRTSKGFAVGALVVMIALVVLYAKYW